MENEAKEAQKLSKKLELGYQVTSQPGKLISKDLTADEKALLLFGKAYTQRLNDTFIENFEHFKQQFTDDMIISRLQYIDRAILRFLRSGRQTETILEYDDNEKILRTFENDEEEQEFINKFFELYCDAYIIRGACEHKYGKNLPIIDYKAVKDIVKQMDEIEKMKREDTLLDLQFAKHFLNYKNY